MPMPSFRRFASGQARRANRRRSLDQNTRTMPINTVASSVRYRSLLIDHSKQRIRITNYKGTEQEQDLSESPNCGGFGRIRHFSRQTSDGWVPNPLPIDPALRALGSEGLDTLRAQVFQNAACN